MFRVISYDMGKKGRKIKEIKKQSRCGDIVCLGLFFFSDQNLTRIRMMTHVQIIEEFPQDIHTYQSAHRGPRHIQSFWSCPSSLPEDVSGPEPHSTFSKSLSHRGLYPSKVLTTSRSPPLLYWSCSEGSSSGPEALFDLCRYLCNSVLPHIHNMYCPFKCGQLWTAACNPNQPTPMIMAITTDLVRTYRAVTTIHQFLLHVSIHVRYILSFFSKKRGRIPNHQSTHYYCNILLEYYQKIIIIIK